jgi:hypothetical protein
MAKYVPRGQAKRCDLLRNLIKFTDRPQWDETPPGQLPLEPLLSIVAFLPVSPMILLSLSSLPPPPESRCQARHLRPAMNKNDTAEIPTSRKEGGVTNTVLSE